MTRFPFPPYPNSWYRVLSSSDLGRGTVKSLHYLGSDIVAFRSKDGRAHVFDAYCPHLGAHLGVRGKIVGDTIECPFHGWRFDCEGTCVEIPYAKKIPPKARLRRWPSREANGSIYVYYHAEGAEPTFEPPVVPEFESSAWTSTWVKPSIVSCHVQDINENFFDTLHFTKLHRMSSLPDLRIETDGPIAICRQRVVNRVLGLVREHDIVITLYGAGVNTVRLSSSIGELLMIVTKTPIEGVETEQRLEYRVKKQNALADTAIRLGARFNFYLDSLLEQPIMQRKLHWTKPVLCDSDGPIMKFRKWHSQFYSEPRDEGPRPAEPGGTKVHLPLAS